MFNTKQNRRGFGKTLAAGAAAALGGSAKAEERHKDAASSPHENLTLPRRRIVSGRMSADGRTFQRAAGEVPVVASADVVVCGGGPAGVAAALAAARSGAKTLLIEVHGCLGGIWTTGALSLVIDHANKPGIMSELRDRLQSRRAARVLSGSRSLVYDPESMKRTLEELLVEAGVRIRLHTRVVAAAKDPHNRLELALTESKSGPEAWQGRVFVDCTGDGDLAALAGCRFDLGRPDNGATQPMSLMALLAGPSLDEIAPFIRGDAEPRGHGNPKANLLAEMRRAGVDPSYHGPTIFRVRDGFYAMMANHQYGSSATNADDVSQATLEARREVHSLVDALRALGGAWKNLQLITTAEQIGTREGRRIHGHYRVVAEDLARGATFPDAVCKVRFGIDVHSTDQGRTKEIEAKPFASKPYDIPLRALIARDVDGLLMAGRCISGDFIAHSSYRVTGNAVAMGEAAGVTAAYCAANDIPPHQCPFSAIAAKLPGFAS